MFHSWLVHTAFLMEHSTLHTAKDTLLLMSASILRSCGSSSLMSNWISSATISTWCSLWQDNGHVFLTLTCTDISLPADAKTGTANWSNFYTKTPPNSSFSLAAPKPTFLVPSAALQEEPSCPRGSGGFTKPAHGLDYGRNCSSAAACLGYSRYSLLLPLLTFLLRPKYLIHK